MAQVMTFPTELERHFFRDTDKGFLLTWLVVFIIFNILTYNMARRPPKLLSAEEIRSYTETIYRVKPAPTERVEPKKEKKAAETAPEQRERPKEEEVAEEKPVTEVAKQVRIVEEREKRRDRQESKLAKVSEAAQKLKILAGPTAAGGRRRAGAAEAARAVGLATGGMKGYDVKEMAGMVGSADMAKKVKKLRGAGDIGGDVGDFEIDIAELKTMSVEDLESMLKEAPVELNRSAITARGSGTKSQQRSQSAIADVVLRNKNQANYCYLTYKRRDSSLKGRVVIEFTIAASGEVVRVRTRTSEWGGNSLGADVERCITSLISSWHFDAIAESEGNVTAGATYIFGD